MTTASNPVLFGPSDRQAAIRTAINDSIDRMRAELKANPQTAAVASEIIAEHVRAVWVLLAMYTRPAAEKPCRFTFRSWEALERRSEID